MMLAYTVYIFKTVLSSTDFSIPVISFCFPSCDAFDSLLSIRRFLRPGFAALTYFLRFRVFRETDKELPCNIDASSLSSKHLVGCPDTFECSHSVILPVTQPIIVKNCCRAAAVEQCQLPLSMTPLSCSLYDAIQCRVAPLSGTH